ncbi:MAG: flavin reductase [Candidatus Bathyarchaeia archaeon]
MVTSVNEDGSYRCSPFTWLLPVSKKDCFIVMMRKESKTLANLKRSPEIAISWMPASRAVAQLVKETRAPENAYEFEMIVPIGFSMPVPKLSLYALEGRVLEIREVDVCEEQTHDMVFCKGERVWMMKDFHLPLLHVGCKSFAIADGFEVEGY